MINIDHFLLFQTISMPNCYHCQIKIGDLPYRCKFCGMIFCNKHRLPENHDCPFDLRNKGDFFDSDKNFLLYQDALEYMGNKLTVAKIYDYVTSKQFTKEKAIELLNYFLENSDDYEIKKVSILAFKVLELKSDKAFNVLESSLLSEEDPDVKKIAIEVLSYNFPKKSKKLLSWISSHDKDLKRKNG